MKKSLFFGLVAILGLIGCSRNQEIDVPDANLSIFARTESPADTKTVVESGVHIYWEPGDEIAVFMGDESAKFTTDITDASGTATFKGTFGDQEWPKDLDLWAVYPFFEDATFDGETITTTLPSEQVAREGSFGKDMNLAIAHSNSSSLQFYNVGGGIRFSMMEEGIKKVMFEGLSGEIISGKVKIGLDNNGKPVVQEVTGGSQFITLLPPTGKETFDKDTWYYIVAIPGTLEGGYKLRFYKDTDYARKVSEKKVEIKRSIFGSIEKADMGIEYEATTTHFPETDDDWEKSFVLTTAIGETLENLRDNTDDINVLVDQLQKTEGVSYALLQPNHATLSVLQKDSVIVNYLLNVGGEPLSDMSNPIGVKRALSRRDYNYTGNYTSEGGKRVLVSSPFQDDTNMPLEKWEGFLSSAFDDIVIRTNEDPVIENRPDITSFLGEELCQYDLIIIATHGGTGYYAKMKDTFWDAVQGNAGEPDELSKVYGQTVLTSCTEYDEKGLKAIKKKLSMEEIAIVGVEKTKSNGKKFTKYYLAMTPNFIGDSRFDGIGVVLQACSSAYYHSSGQQGSMVQAFLKKGASFVTGYLFDAQTQISSVYATDFLYSITMGGLSVYDSYYYWNNSDLYSLMYKSLLDNGAIPSTVNPSNFKIYPEEKQDILLRDFKPTLNQPVPKEKNIHFSWNSSLSSYEYSSHYFSFSWVYGEENYRIKVDVVYDVYVDTKAVTTQPISEKSFACPVGAGEHSWYVITTVKEGDHVLASYKSEEVKFSVTETPSTEETLLSRTYNGKTYSIIRKNVSSTDCRINGDGSKFYTCSYSVKVDGNTYDLPGSFYSYTDRDFRDTGPVMAVNEQTGEIHVFFIEKDTDETYGMCGYMFNIANGTISRQTVFTYSNFGWFPFFTWEEDQLALNCFSYSGYFAIIAFQNDNWTLYSAGDIYPDDFKAKQRGKELIFIY